MFELLKTNLKKLLCNFYETAIPVGRMKKLMRECDEEYKLMMKEMEQHVDENTGIVKTWGIDGGSWELQLFLDTLDVDVPCISSDDEIPYVGRVVTDEERKRHIEECMHISRNPVIFSMVSGWTMLELQKGEEKQCA